MKSYKKVIFLIFSVIFILFGIYLNEPFTIKQIGSFLCHGCLGF